jgi:thermitase
MFKLIPVLGMLFMSLSLLASEAQKGVLILKMKKNKAVPESSLITSKKKLIGDIYALRTQNDSELKSFLEANKDIEYVTQSFKRKSKLESPSLYVSDEIVKDTALQTPFSDPRAGDVWSFADASEFGTSANMAYANPLQTQKAKITIAVVDTGIDYGHEDIKENLWVNESEIPGNGIDDDQNGYVDDIIGISLLNRDSNGKATNQVQDCHGHGTHVSGTIGAVQNNGLGIAGLASKVEIMTIKAVPCDGGDETDLDVMEAYIYAAKNGARIINSSFGKKQTEQGNAVEDVMNEINKRYKTLFITAAGNDNKNIDQIPTYPASFRSPNMLVVAAVSPDGDLGKFVYGSFVRYFSNYGLGNVDIAAPGVDILSSVPNNGYQFFSGTSMAAPTVTGVATEVLSHYPMLTGEELKLILMKSIDSNSNFAGKTVTGGGVNLYKSLRNAKMLLKAKGYRY